MRPASRTKARRARGPSDLSCTAGVGAASVVRRCGQPGAPLARGHDQGMLRLDPAYPPLWRTASALQLGADPTLVVDDPAPWQERLLHELGRGVPEVALEPIARMLGAPPAQARSFVAGISRALESETRSPLARVQLRVPETIATADTEALAGALSAFGAAVEIAPVEAVVYEPVPPGVPVVVVAGHLVDPRHAAALARADIAHLPVVLSGGQVTVGPLVRPGETACLACLDAQRTDDDASWPLVAAQLVGRSSPAFGRALAVEAGIAAGRLLTDAAPRVGRSVTIHAGSARREWRSHHPHERCRCRSLAETATAVEAATPDRATTTATGCARPA